MRHLHRGDAVGAARHGGVAPPAVRWGLAGIVGLAVCLRVAHVLALRSTPWFDHLVVDPQFYDEWATRIAAGDWLGNQAFYMDPLYPYVLGMLYRLAGRDLLLARFLNVAFSAGACVCVARLGQRVGGRWVGLLAALGFALYRPEIFYAAEIDKTSLSVFLTAAALALAAGRAHLGAGVVLGLAALTRANFLLLAPLVALAFLRDSGGRGTRAAALFAAGFTLALLPLLWRNHHVSGAWVVTTVQAGQNFYTGNNPTNPYGAYGQVPFVRPNPHFEEADFRAEAERRVGHPLGSGAVSRFWFAETFRHMRAEPGFAARAMVRKAALFWNDFEISDNQDQYLLERDSWVLRLPLPGFGCLVSFALLGAVAAFRARRLVRLLAGFVLAYAASVIAFFIFSRYRIQVVPALLPLAGLGVLELAARVRAGAWRRVASGAAIVAGAALFAFHTIGIFSADNDLVVDMRLRHLGEIYFIAGRPERTLAAFHEALARCPTRCPQTLAELGDIYLQTGRLADGETYFRTFTRAHPESPDGWRALARLLDAAGKPTEAAEAARRAEVR